MIESDALHEKPQEHNLQPKPQEHSATMPSPQPAILWLAQEAARATETTGGKAANLARLASAGFPVPNGFVITTGAFERQIAAIPAPDRSEVRRSLLTSPLERSLRDQLEEALRHLGGVKVAVRSSGVAEDLEGASFAGQYDSYLGVEMVDEVDEAVRKCWASALGDRVLQYQGAKETEPAPMAVLIQEMVEADAAGVAFTANPVTGRRDETVVSAVRGLGERLVSGQASPDEWFVRDGTAIPHSTPEQAIDAGRALRVAALARRVEAHLGTPQDIEWAIAGESIYLLQARPITTLDPQEAASRAKPIPVPVEPPEGYWEREESHYPDPLSPATRTTFLPAINRAFEIACNEHSLMIEALQVREIGGWIYQRTVPLGGKDMPAPPAWLLPVLIRVVPPLRKRIAGAVAAVREDRVGAAIERWENDWKESLTAERNRLLAVDLTGLTDEQLIGHLHETREFLALCLERHMLLNVAIQLILADYAFASRDLLGWDEATMMRAFSGLSEASSAPARSIARLALEVRADPKLQADVTAGLDVATLRRAHPEFARRFDEHVAEFGSRALRHELSYPTVRESPQLVLRLLRDQLQRRFDPDEDLEQLRQQRQELLAEAKAQLAERPAGDRKRFFEALERAERAYPVREEHGLHDRDAPVALQRYALLEAGLRLEARRQLDTADDVFFLEWDEVLGALTDGGALTAVAERRKAELEWVLANPGPASYGKEPPPPPPMRSFPAEARRSNEGVLWSLELVFAARQSGQVQSDSRHITGIAASAGSFTGPVRVIRDESEFHKIQPGDVLVCPITSPVWSMLFPSIGALVTDSGGILSHSAIIAREYRIPGVVATGNATELLRDGQIVTVDGSKGFVRAKTVG